jgi:hypothetical protein
MLCRRTLDDGYLLSEGSVHVHSKNFQEVSFQLKPGRTIIQANFSWKRDLMANLAICNCNDVRSEGLTWNACQKALL